MNDQLPPIDSDLRGQLTRRSAGRLPKGLLDGVLTALDSAPAPAAIARLPRLIWRVPRMAMAGMGAALVAILAIAIAFPAFRGGPATSPAGYPADRALTTAELAALLAGPPLPTNAALVASVTIDAKTDVCPMNRYPTIGVVEGMGSQVCVMGATVSAYLSGPKATGTFAFRYLAPGYLGFLGQISPASASRLAFHVTEDWPLAGKTFLVDAWLVARDQKCIGFTTPAPAGDPLNPSGSEPCVWSWLSDNGNPGAGVDPSADPLSLFGKARLVEAGGMRQIDSVPLEATHGVFVVRSVVEQCPNASPQDNVGCSAWRILAKVADISLPQPTAPPTATYPADRALTTAELASLLAGPALPTNTALVANVSIDVRSDVCPMSRYPTVGIVEGMSSQVCVMAADLSAVPPGHTASDTFAFRYLAPGYLGLIGEITPASSARVAFHINDEWPLAGETFLVEGWLGAAELTVSCAAPPTAGDPLAPNGEDCPYDDWMGTDSTAPGIQADHEYVLGSPAPSFDPLSLRGNARHVEAGGMRQIDSIDPGEPRQGVYVVRSVTEQCPGALPQDSRGCSAWRILAKVAEISVPGPSGTAHGTSTAAPTTAPPATPLAPALTGVIGTGNRPLTVDELETLMVGQPDHLAGRIVIVEAPIPTQISCQSDANGGGCAVNTKPLAQTGTWAVSIGTEGALRLVGQIATPVAAGYVFSVEEACLDTNLKAGAVLVIFGVLNKDSVGSWRLTQAGTFASCGSIDLGAGSYASMGPGLPSNYIGEGPRAYYLVRVGSPWSVLARLEPAAGPG